jgi:ACR3 family arsenite transporter
MNSNPIENASPSLESEKKAGLSKFEKYLYIWIGICIVIGIAISQLVPGIAIAIDAIKIGTVSIPIGICLFLMMYPAVLNLRASELKKIKKNPVPILLTLVSNWIVAPLVGTFLAGWLLPGNEQLIVAVILLHASPCTAMVLVWGYLANGNQEQNVVNTSINTVTIIFLYAPMVGLLLSLQNVVYHSSISVDWLGLLITATIFIGLPIAGYFSKKILIGRKGEDWFNNVYREALGKVAIVALLMTLIILYSLNGGVMLRNPDKLLLVSVPLLISFLIVLTYNIMMTKLAKLHYKEAVVTVLIGSSSHFEIAIATAITLYGVGSMAALGTTMGLFWEVPVMLSVVYLARYLRKKNFWLPSEFKYNESKK